MTVADTRVKMLDGRASPRLVSVLDAGGIAVIPTDTIYGIVAKALDRTAVSRLFALRRTTARKPFVILIDTATRVKAFGITLDAKQKEFLRRVWPGKVSVVLPCPQKRFSYLHRGTSTLAFRLPKNKPLVSLLRKTGPLVAPSANPEGRKPAETIAHAKRYFGAQVSVYRSAGRLRGKPSTLVSLTGPVFQILRAGAVTIKPRA